MRSLPTYATLLLTSLSHITFAQDAEAPAVEALYTEQIAALMVDRQVRAGMDLIIAIEPQSRRDLIELTEIPAPPFEEEARAARFA